MKYLRIAFLALVANASIAQAQSWQWAQETLGKQRPNSSAPDIDRSGNVYVTGGFSDSISFGTISLHSPRTTSIFLAKYDANGRVLWATVAASCSAIRVTGIDVDNNNEMSIVGQFLTRGLFWWGRCRYADVTRRL